MIIGLIVLIFLDFKPDVHFKGTCLAISTGIIGFAGALCFLFAVKSGKVSVVAMFTALSPVLTVILGCLVLKESLSLKEGLGVISAFIAIILFTV
jgi:transporter family protein